MIQRNLHGRFPEKLTDLSGCRSPSRPAYCCYSRGRSSRGAAPRCRSVCGLGRADRPGVCRPGCHRSPRTPCTSWIRTRVGWTRTGTELRARPGTCRRPWRWPVSQAVRQTLRSPSSLVSLLSPVRSQNKPRPAAAETARAQQSGRACSPPTGAAESQRREPPLTSGVDFKIKLSRCILLCISKFRK